MPSPRESSKRFPSVPLFFLFLSLARMRYATATLSEREDGMARPSPPFSFTARVKMVRREKRSVFSSLHSSCDQRVLSFNVKGEPLSSGKVDGLPPTPGSPLVFPYLLIEKRQIHANYSRSLDSFFPPLLQKRIESFQGEVFTTPPLFRIGRPNAYLAKRLFGMSAIQARPAPAPFFFSLFFFLLRR